MGRGWTFWRSRVASAINNAKRFAVWTGANINHGSVSEIDGNISGILPDGSWQKEWIVKAGEGGSYQARHLHSSWGDPSPIAISSADDFADRTAECAKLGLKLTPYVVARARPEWLAGEISQITELSAVAEKLIINLEPGADYWNGPTSPIWIAENYLGPIRKQFSKSCKLELACIPRQWVFNALGGTTTIESWLDYCEFASWECYDAVATDLRVDDSFERLTNWFPDKYNTGNYRIPIVNRSRINAWASTEFANNGLEVWYLDGD